MKSYEWICSCHAVVMGTKLSTCGLKRSNYHQLTPEEHTLVKSAWFAVEKNPEFHGNRFFTSLLEKHPEYVKHFTADTKYNVIVDARVTAKFTVIIETLGFLILDFHNKPKQLDQLIGYVAMVHKDMRLGRQDMRNFGVYLVKYLLKTFPESMTTECTEVFQKYLNSILNEISNRIEQFQRDDILQLEKVKRKKRDRFLPPCSVCFSQSNNLIFGQTLAYWNDRKREWDERWLQWDTNNMLGAESIQISSTDDEETSPHKSKTDDETSEIVEFNANVLNSRGTFHKKISIAPNMPKTSIAQAILPNLRKSSNEVQIINEVAISSSQRFDADAKVEDDRKNKLDGYSLSPRERRRRILDSKNNESQKRSLRTGRNDHFIAKSDDEEKEQPPYKSVHSSARQRRRLTLERM